MTRFSVLVPLCLALPALAAAAPASVSGAVARFTVQNPGPAARRDMVVRLPVPAGADPAGLRVVAGEGSGAHVIAAQPLDEDGDGKADVLAVLVDLPAGGRETFTLRRGGPSAPAAPVRATASLGVKDAAGVFHDVDAYSPPPEHKVGDGIIAFERPGWESDRVGYRLYLDNRNVTDVFGKRRPEPALDHVGRGPSYHVLGDWGMDVLHVGDSLGAGGLGVWRDGRPQWLGPPTAQSVRLVDKGPLVARVAVDTRGWRLGQAAYDLDAVYEIDAGSRLTLVRAKASSADAPLVAGLVRHEGVTVLRDPGVRGGRWAYVATLGAQSEVKDGLGLVLFYPVKAGSTAGEDAHNEYVRFGGGRAAYAFGAVWAQEPGAPISPAAFARWARQAAETLGHPAVIRPK